MGLEVFSEQRCLLESYCVSFLVFASELACANPPFHSVLQSYNKRAVQRRGYAEF